MPASQGSCAACALARAESVYLELKNNIWPVGREDEGNRLGQDASVAEKIGCLKREQLTWHRVAG